MHIISQLHLGIPQISTPLHPWILYLKSLLIIPLDWRYNALSFPLSWIHKKLLPKKTFLKIVTRFSILSFFYSPCDYSVQFSSVTQSYLYLTLCDPMDCSTPGLPVHHQLPEFTQTHVHLVSDTIQSSHPPSSPSPAFNLFQHQGLFKWVSSSHQVAKIFEFQLQHQFFQWIFRTDFL